MFSSDYLEGQIASLIPANLHVMPCDGYPGETGAGGTDMAAARTLFEMNAVVGSSRTNTNQEEITVSVAGTHRFFKLYDAASAGNFLGYTVCGTALPQTFQLVDTTNDDVVCVSHGFIANDEVFFLPEAAGKPLPTGITEGQVYYIISAGLTANAFRFSANPGGAAVNATAVGSGLVCRIAPKAFGVSDIIRVNAGQLIWTGF